MGIIGKIILIFIFFCAVIYVIFPFDIIPDIIPIIGWIDDLFVGLIGLVSLIISFKM